MGGKFESSSSYIFSLAICILNNLYWESAVNKSGTLFPETLLCGLPSWYEIAGTKKQGSNLG